MTTRTLIANSLRFLMVLLLFASAPAALSEMNRFSLHVGAVKTVSVGTVDKVAVGNENVVNVSVLDTGELLLIPRTAGETDLYVWKPGQRMLTYRINVLPGNMQHRLSVVRSVLSGFDGIKSRIVDGIIVTEGEIDPIFMDMYLATLQRLPEVVSLVRPAQVPMRDLIRIKAQVVEIDEQYRKEVGIRWADSVEGPTIAAVGTWVDNDIFRIVPADGNADWSSLLESLPPSNHGFHPFVGFSSALLSQIQLIEENGAARTLAEPVLTARSGETATFLSGGEIPYQAVTADGQINVVFREYGIRLEIAPASDQLGNVVSRIVAEVSTVDFRTAINGVPGLLSRRAESTINARSGETIVISGLLSTQDSTDLDKVPVLGDLPIVGGLFRSRNKTEFRKEVVILVTPEIVSSGQALREDTLKNIAELRGLKGGDSSIDAELKE